MTRDIKRSHYRILGLVGQGQFGRVFCAIHRKTGKLVALKELDKARFPTHQFLRELRFLLSLQHPNIVGCHALEHTATGRYLVMDYCEGGTLRGLMHEENQLNPCYGLQLVVDVLAGLEQAHARGIVHCDIKPENILLTLCRHGWTARISDFGIARLSQELNRDFSNTGSPAYMAPERFYGQYSPSSDLYAVGILLFEILVGYRPFSGLPKELMSAHLNQPVQVPDAVAPSLKPVILKALQKLPARRYRSALEMRSAVLEAISQMDDRPPPSIYFFAEPLLPTPVGAAIRQDPLEQAVQQLLVQPDLTLSNNEAQPSWQVYQIASDRIDCRSLPSSLLPLPQSSDFADPSSPPNIHLDFPTPIQAVAVASHTSQVLTQSTLYSLPTEVTQWATNQDLSFSQQALLPYLNPVGIDRQARWGAGFLPATAQLPAHLVLWSLRAGMPVISHQFPLPWLTASTLQPFEMMILDSRHGLLCSHYWDQSVPANIVGLHLQGFTRRGTLMGDWQLPVCLGKILLSPSTYRLIATEPEHPTSLLLIDLKPLRTQRLEVGLVPHKMAAMSWGYAIAAADGEMVLLSLYGEIIGRVYGPPCPTAMTGIEPHSLLIATWQDGVGQLFMFDLQQFDLDMVF